MTLVMPMRYEAITLGTEPGELVDHRITPVHLAFRHWPTMAARYVVRRSLTANRGGPVQDGRVSLLTVDFNLTEHVLRLAATFRAHVDQNGPIVVVQNGSRRHNRKLRRAGARVVGWGLNIGHDRALDWGLRHVRTQYVLICDPDAIVINDRFRAELLERLHAFGVCGIVISEALEHQRYHPICLAFDMRVWREGTWSMDAVVEDRGRDVGWEVTARTGGLNPDATLPLTRGGENGCVWAESFSNTYALSRIRGFAAEETIDGYPVEQVRRYHERWLRWADAVAAGAAGVNDFPEPVPF